MADVFGLVDKDNDKTLYNLKKELDEFWSIVNEEIGHIQDEDLKQEADQWHKEKKDAPEM